MCIVDDFDWQMWISIIVTIIELWIPTIFMNSRYSYPNMDIHNSLMAIYDKHKFQIFISQYGYPLFSYGYL